MKKLIFIFAMAIASLPLQAQIEQTYTEVFDSIFINVSRVQATTGILYERVVSFADLVNFNFNVNASVDTSNYHHFMQSYSELYRAAFMPSAQVHVYDLWSEAYLPGDKNNFHNLIKVYQEEATKQGKAFFVAEFHAWDSRCEETIDAIVANRAPVSAVWLVSDIQGGTLATDPLRQHAVLKYIREANLKLKI